MSTVARLYRYPVKGLGEEALTEAVLEAGHGIEADRRWAIAHPKGDYDAAAPAWRPRKNFVQTAHSPDLARVTTRLTGDGVTASHPARGEITADLSTEAGGAELCRFAESVAGETQPGPYLLAKTEAAMFDVEGAHLSLLSTTALRILSDRAGVALEERRFRGNVWLDGLAPWEEFDLIGKEVTLGTARLRILEPNTRCAAPGASPATGARDVDVTGLLHTHYGHMDFGVYAEVIGGGRVAVGDTLSS